MKREWFFFPLGYIWRWMGGIPVDRKNKNSLTEQMINRFKSKDSFHLAIAPEGTRKKNSDWKTGFYYIAVGAGVPISLAYIDFFRKEVGVAKIFYPTAGKAQEDLLEIKDFYKNIKGKHLERFSL